MSTQPTILITGANRGIGKATAAGVAARGARVLLVGRSQAAMEASRAEIIDATGNQRVEVMIGDLSSQAEIRRMAREAEQRLDRLDVLINNAGVVVPQRRESVDGLEMQFALNHMAYFQLTRELQGLLAASAPSRVVNVSSEAHRRCGGMHWDDLHFNTGYTALRAYCQSKLANILFSRELARRLRGTGVSVNSLHPGVIATGLLGTFLKVPKRAHFLMRWCFPGPEKGARTSIHLALAEDQATTGCYFKDCRRTEPSPPARDDAAAARLWEESESLLV